MRKKLLITLSTILIAALLAITGYIGMLYRQGDESNYTPPPPPSVTPKEQALSDIQNLSRAVEAYFIKNMEYPQKLDSMVPEFIDRVGLDPLSAKPYLYTVTDNGGSARYRISLPDPSLYNVKECFIENGTVTQK